MALAVCMLAVDPPENAEIWEKWGARLFINRKAPISEKVELKWIESGMNKHRIQHEVTKTQWGHSSLVVAARRLLCEALEAKENFEWIALVSSDSIPIVTLEQAIWSLDYDTSYFHPYEEAIYQQELLDWLRASRDIEKGWWATKTPHIGSQFFVVCRKDAKLLVEMPPEIIEEYDVLRSFVPDLEKGSPCKSLLQEPDEIIPLTWLIANNSKIRMREVMFAPISEDGHHARVQHDLPDRWHAKESKSIFSRKHRDKIPIQTWNGYVGGE
jgi:hypothetical protein